MTKFNPECPCKNCRHVAKQRSRALRASRPSGKGMETVVDAWNDTLNSFPCLKPQSDTETKVGG